MRRWFKMGLCLCLTLNLAIFMALGPVWAMSDEPWPLFSGFSQIEGPLQLQVTFDPPVVGAGQPVTATFTLTNQSNSAAAPAVDILIPPTLALNTKQLPIGLSLNALADHLTWLPVVQPNGDREQIQLHLTTVFADVLHPEQSLAITLQNGESVQTMNATLWLGVPPQVSLTALAPVAVGQLVSLQASASGPGPLTQTWDLGDGRVIHAQNPTVVFPAAGSYKISVQVANPLAAAAATTTLTVTDAPFAQFSADDLTPGVGQPVQFINQSGGAGPLTYSWDFGDGTTGDGLAPQHSYSQAGTYDVRLVVANSVGQAETTLPFIVGELPTADFIITESITAGLPISAQAFTDPSVTLVSWDMGDGRTAEGLTISHTYTRQGNYWVTMTAHNEFGTTQIGREVSVAPGFNFLFIPLLVTGNISTTLPLTSTEVAASTPDILPDEAAIITETPPPAAMGLTPAEHLLWYINEARRLHELPPLTYSYELSVAAQRHSDDMGLYGYTGHTGSDDTRPENRQAQAGYTGFYAGEATYWGYDQVTAVVEFWVNSPPHRTMILNPLTTDVGVGYTYNPNSPSVWYWVAEFGTVTPPAPLATTETRPDIDLRHATIPRTLTNLFEPA